MHKEGGEAGDVLQESVVVKQPVPAQRGDGLNGLADHRLLPVAQPLSLGGGGMKHSSGGSHHICRLHYPRNYAFSLKEF